MSLYSLLRNNPNPSEKEIEECFDGKYKYTLNFLASLKLYNNVLLGNLCRCTGYRPILDAAKTVNYFFILRNLSFELGT